MNNKVRGDEKCTVRFLPHLQKIRIFSFPRQCSNMRKVRWVASYAFCSKFHTFSSRAKNVEDQLRFDKVTDN